MMAAVPFSLIEAFYFKQEDRFIEYATSRDRYHRGGSDGAGGVVRSARAAFDGI
jgi:hypothetical protein